MQHYNHQDSSNILNQNLQCTSLIFYIQKEDIFHLNLYHKHNQHLINQVLCNKNDKDHLFEDQLQKDTHNLLWVFLLVLRNQFGHRQPVGQSVSVQKHESEIINGSESVEEHKGVHLQGVSILNNSFDDQHSRKGYPLFGTGFLSYTQLESDQSSLAQLNGQASPALGSPNSRHTHADNDITLRYYPLLWHIHQLGFFIIYTHTFISAIISISYGTNDPSASINSRLSRSKLRITSGNSSIHFYNPKPTKVAAVQLHQFTTNSAGAGGLKGVGITNKE
ncbi:MAG: hypothetical protein EZS28_008997 [Streblomastix strix]|uniref:Uncharacterized protein n=1 Tax=Streblomastix strix TaxID=222440 RepID=A0A5J4WK96_9EUKA|nr:MAG: hypothetical protein EZS28_008997 [Streblomastix strix]